MYWFLLLKCLICPCNRPFQCYRFQEIKFIPPEFSIIKDYSNILIRGYKLNLLLNRQELSLLQAGNSIRYSRLVVLWHIIHISISFYHIRGQSFPEDDFPLLQKLLDHFISGLTASLTVRFIYLLSCYVVGVHDRFDSSIAYKVYTRSCTELKIADEEYDIVLDPDLINFYRNLLRFPSM